MSKIIKEITGEASFVIEEEFADEEKAQVGKDPEDQKLKTLDIKIDKTTWRKKDE